MAGNKKHTAPNKTPPPVGQEKDFSFGRSQYGANAFSGAPSVTPGKTVVSPLGQNLRATGDDGLLDVVAKEGTAKSDAGYSADSDGVNSQLRKIASGNVPAAHGMRSRTQGQEGGTIPAAARPVTRSNGPTKP